MRMYISVFLLLCAFASSLHAQELRDRANALLARVEAGGIVRSAKGTQIGRFDADGFVRNRQGALAGRIERNGMIRDRMGTLVGRVESNGTVRDRSNAQLGRIEQGIVRGRSNQIIGYARGVPSTYAAVLFFFSLL